MNKEYAVIECDEAAARTVFGQLKPKVIVVTNLFRDQLDRYGEVTHTLENIRAAIQGAPEAVLCLNADCSLTASLALDLPNPVVWFGVEKGAVPSRPVPEISDATHCIRCKTAYTYDYVSYGHLGGFRCPKCGYRRHRADAAVTAVPEQRLDGSSIVLEHPGREAAGGGESARHVQHLQRRGRRGRDHGHGSARGRGHPGPGQLPVRLRPDGAVRPGQGRAPR